MPGEGLCKLRQAPLRALDNTLVLFRMAKEPATKLRIAAALAYLTPAQLLHSTFMGTGVLNVLLEAAGSEELD